MTRGKLRIYLGAAPGVGKTYAMLDEGWRRRHRGTDVVIGYVEAHTRPNTLAQIRDLEVVGRHRLLYRDRGLEEMDLDAVLERHPAVALVDELAHSNVPGSRNQKRWQDIEELLAAGIDVISTVNIQHLSSLNDVVERITGVVQRETVPDAVVRAADQIELVDMSPEALRRRMAHGNIYVPDKVDEALAHYFRVGNLGALRELALLWVADRVDDELASYRDRYGISQPWETKERVVVALTGAPGGEHLLRRAARIAARVNGELIGVHVRATDGMSHPRPEGLVHQRDLLDGLGGRYTEVTGVDVAESLVDFARAENASQLVVGASARSRLVEMTRGSVINRIVRDAAPIDVHVISAPRPAGVLPALPRRRRLVPVSRRRRQIGWVLGTVGMFALALALSPLHGSFGLSGALLCILVGVVAVATIGGVPPAAAATVVGGLSADYFFTPPIHSLRVERAADAVALILFLATAAAVSALVDRLGRRGLQASRAQAEAEALARLAGGSVLAGAEPLPLLVSELRRTFDLDGVAILAPDRDGWVAVAVAGAPVDSPERATFSAELAEGTVLVLAGSTLGAEDTRLLSAFVMQLRQAQDRMKLETQAATAVELAEADTLRTALLAAVSHDLRTPLASIKAAATSLLSQDVAWSPDDVRDFSRTIDTESDRLTALVANLLDLSRLQAGALPTSVRPVALDDVLYAAVDSLADAGSRIAIDVNPSTPPVEADRGLLERAIANVLSNALIWSPPGAAVQVQAGVTEWSVRVYVIDQGPGIPPEARDGIFEPFQRLGDRTGAGPNGLGLGLAVARGFVESMGGELSVEDTPGGGATFVFTLARAAARDGERSMPTSSVRAGAR
jgi:two-component system, OmpR family, sensor histidine kinase KdpD